MTATAQPTGVSHTARRLAVGLWIGLAALAITELVVFGGARHDDALLIDAGYGLVAVAAVVLALAARRRIDRERSGWLLLSAVLITPALGGAFLLEFVARAGVAAGKDLPVWGTVLSVGYLLAAVGTVLLVRSRLGKLWRSVWLDGMIGGLTVAALVAIAVSPFIESSPAALASVRTVYIIGDVLLASVAVIALTLTRWRGNRELPVIAGLIVILATIHAARVTSVAGVTLTGTVFDALIAATLLLIVDVAWRPGPRRLREHPYSRQMVALLVTFGIVAVAILVSAEALDADLYIIALASAVVLAWIARAAITIRDQQRLLTRLDEERLADTLTGLGNRRRLAADLRTELRAAQRGERRLLVFVDLDDFKAFNDTFGHLEGDVLLCRVAERLVSIAGRRSYRLGGDEFCMVISPNGASIDAALAQALTFKANGVVVTASHGAVELGDEIRSFDDALRACDLRLYRAKSSRRGGDRVEVRELGAAWMPAARQLRAPPRAPESPMPRPPASTGSPAVRRARRHG